MLLVGVAIAVSMLAAIGTAGAQEISASPVLNSTPDDTWMTNGTVYSVIRSGDYVYVGGKFTRVRSSPTGTSFKATNLARFRADTGVGDPTWTPDVTGADMTITTVYALTAAGGKIWVGGKFEAVDGIARRNLAAVSAETGVVDPVVDPVVGTETNNGVRALLADPTGTKVYVGGYFLQIDGLSRRYLGAVDLLGDLDNTWKPKTDANVRNLSASCDGATVFAGGKFRSAAGSGSTAYSPRETIARFDATTGALHPWAIPAGTVPNEQVASDLAVACDGVSNTRVSAGYLGQNWARSFRLDNGDVGTLVWEDKTAGNVQTVTMLGTDKLIIGGHFSNVTEDAGVVPGAQRWPRTRIALLNLQDGSVDPNWAPKIDGNFLGPGTCWSRRTTSGSAASSRRWRVFPEPTSRASPSPFEMNPLSARAAPASAGAARALPLRLPASLQTVEPPASRAPCVGNYSGAPLGGSEGWEGTNGYPHRRRVEATPGDGTGFILLPVSTAVRAHLTQGTGRGTLRRSVRAHAASRRDANGEGRGRSYQDHAA